MSKISKVILLIISTVLTGTLISALFTFRSDKEKISNDFARCVYLQSSKTVFNSDDTISVTLKNVSDEDFEDVVIHLTYCDNAGNPVGLAYSEQKTVTFVAEEEITIVFQNPGWVESSYNEIKVSEKLSASNWGVLKNGATFIDPKFEMVKPITIGLSIAIGVFVCVDILLLVLTVLHKGSNKKEKEII